jgi:hypothetical protein
LPQNLPLAATILKIIHPFGNISSKFGKLLPNESRSCRKTENCGNLTAVAAWIIFNRKLRASP